MWPSFLKNRFALTLEKLGCIFFSSARQFISKTCYVNIISIFVFSALNFVSDQKSVFSSMLIFLAEEKSEQGKIISSAFSVALNFSLTGSTYLRTRIL